MHYSELTIAGPPFLDEITAALRAAAIPFRLHRPEAPPQTGVRTHFGERAEEAQVIEVDSERLATAQQLLQTIFADAEQAAHQEAGDDLPTVSAQEELDYRDKLARRERRYKRIAWSLFLVPLCGLIGYASIGSLRQPKAHHFSLPDSWSIDHDDHHGQQLFVRRTPVGELSCETAPGLGAGELRPGDERQVESWMRQRGGETSRALRVSHAGLLDTKERHARVIGIFTEPDGSERKAMGYLLPSPFLYVLCELPTQECLGCEEQIEQLVYSGL